MLVVQPVPEGFLGNGDVEEVQLQLGKILLRSNRLDHEERCGGPGLKGIGQYAETQPVRLSTDQVAAGGGPFSGARASACPFRRDQ